MPTFSKELIELLAEKRLYGTISPEEQELLDQWLSQEPGEQMIWASGDRDEKALRDRLLKHVKEDAGIHPQPARRIPVLQQYRQVAAAAILLLVAGGMSYLLFFKKQAVPPDTTVHNTPVHDVAPGHNGAILTLTNGSRIVLDSTGNGNIAMQGMTRLMKQNGQLIYEKATGGSAENTPGAGSHVTYNTITTPRGRQFKVVLSDGSKAWLNAASSITYPTVFTGAQRVVKITGEVYFEVAEDPLHPFIVSVEQAQVTVLGTRFDVMAYPDEKLIKTTLLEGSVRVSKGTQQVIIAPGQQAGFSSQSDHISVAAAETDRVTAWVNGKLSLNNLDVKAIMRQVSRWYDVDVVFEGPVPQGRFWGVINRNVYLSSVLNVMRANGIDARLKDNKVIVSSN